MKTPSEPTREDLAQALSYVADLLYRVWRGEVTSPSQEVGDALARYAKHPSWLLLATDNQHSEPTP